jgi:hypothetical protein
VGGLSRAPASAMGQVEDRGPPPGAVGAVVATNVPLLVSTSERGEGHARKSIRCPERSTSCGRTNIDKHRGQRQDHHRATRNHRAKRKGRPKASPAGLNEGAQVRAGS